MDTIGRMVSQWATEDKEQINALVEQHGDLVVEVTGADDGCVYATAGTYRLSLNPEAVNEEVDNKSISDIRHLILKVYPTVD